MDIVLAALYFGQEDVVIGGLETGTGGGVALQCFSDFFSCPSLSPNAALAALCMIWPRKITMDRPCSFAVWMSVSVSSNTVCQSPQS